MRRNSKSDAASSSQGRRKDAHLGGLIDKVTGKLVAAKDESGYVDLSESETLSEEDVTGSPVAHKTAVWKSHASSKSDCQESPKTERKVWPHHLHISPARLTIRKQSSRLSGKSMTKT